MPAGQKSRTIDSTGRCHKHTLPERLVGEQKFRLHSPFNARAKPATTWHAIPLLRVSRNKKTSPPTLTRSPVTQKRTTEPRNVVVAGYSQLIRTCIQDRLRNRRTRRSPSISGSNSGST